MKTMSQLIDEAKYIRSKSELCWAFPIVLGLRKLSYQHIIQWIKSCLEKQVDRSSFGSSAEFKEYLHILEEAEDSWSPTKIDATGRYIWDLPNRDTLQIVLARLWLTVAYFKKENECSGKENGRALLEAVMCVELLFDSLEDEETEELFNLLQEYS